jgi:hypothetical protein
MNTFNNNNFMHRLLSVGPMGFLGNNCNLNLVSNCNIFVVTGGICGIIKANVNGSCHLFQINGKCISVDTR